MVDLDSFGDKRLQKTRSAGRAHLEALRSEAMLATVALVPPWARHMLASQETSEFYFFGVKPPAIAA